VTAIGLRALIEYAYTGTIIINDGNLQDVLEAADHLQFVEILTFCSRYSGGEFPEPNFPHSFVPRVVGVIFRLIGNFAEFGCRRLC